VSWGSLQRHLGLLASVLGRDDVASAHFESALARNRGSGALLMLAETQVAYGAMLRRRGERERAAELGEAALQIAAPRGLVDVERRARELQE
jgi:tetratricopeptide (TPR) repeat protein